MTAVSTCKAVRHALWDYSAGLLGDDEHRSVDMHLRECRECNLHRAEVRSIRAGLRSLPARRISPLLGTQLQVIASREQSRQRRTHDLKARMAHFRSRLRLAFDNLLRPLAVPAAGGILASFFCFSIIVDTLHVRPDWRNDIPVGLFTQVALDDVSPFSCAAKSCAGRDIIVQLTIDADGRVTDFSAQGQTTPEQMQEIGNLVLYSTFTPATSFGQRVSGKVLIDIHHIDIRG